MTQLATSQVQKLFQINNVYKRSKRYFDIAKLNHIQKQLQLQRRVPQSSKETIQSRVQESFICSEQLLNDKVNHDLDFFHGKKQRQEIDESQTAYTVRTSKSKAFDMSKMLARSHFQHQKPIYRNEEQFNNFSIAENRPRNSLDFTTFLDRNKSTIKTQRYPNPQHQLVPPQKAGKIYQKNIYDQSNLACYVDYQKKGRSKQKEQIDTSPIYDLAKIRRGQRMTKRNRPHLHEFYHGNGKNDPSQLENRILKENEFFWRSLREEKERLKDYSVTKKKEDEIMGRLTKILNRKKLPDQRKEMCDQKFFRRQSNS